MKPDINSQPELDNQVTGTKVRLDRLVPGSIFRHPDSTLFTVIDAGNLMMEFVEVKIHDKARVLAVHIRTGEVSAIPDHILVEPQYLELVPARGGGE